MIKNNQVRLLKYLLLVLLLVMILGVLQVNAADVTVTVNTGTTYQTLDGFGAACAWYGELLTGNSSKSAIYDLLFTNNLDILRLRNTYGSRNGATFCPYESELVSQGKSRNPNLSVFLVSWSPPTNLKANGVLNGGTLAKVNNAFNYSGFGTYWRDSLVAYQGKGITPDFISIQNEPDYVNSGWETCQLDPAEGANASYGKCLDAVVSSISSISPKPKILGPEAAHIGNNLVQNYMNGLNQSNIDVVGHHLYSLSGDANNPDSFISNMQSIYNSYPNKPKWQSEYDYGSALNHGIIIYNSLVYEQVSAYLFWDLVWTNGGTALITLPNLPSSSYTVTDYFYVVKQFAGWTNPGYKRVAVSSNNSSVRATGFVNGNSLSIILINTSGSAANISLNLNVGVSGSSIYQTTPGGSDKCAYKGSLGSGNTVTVANNSIATVVITTTSGGTSPTPTPTSTPTPTPISGNLITNPDFETGNTSGWAVNGAGSIAVSTAQKHGGTYSLLHTGRTATWNGPLQNITSKVINGTTYACSGWVRLDNTASASITMTIKKTDGGGTTYTNVSTGTASNSSWALLSGNYTLTVSGTLTELSVYFEGPASGINFYVDDVSVSSGATSTPTPTPTPTATPTPTSGNLITNPGLETGNTTGWSVNGAGTIAVSTAQKHSGSYSLLHTGRTATWNGPLQNITSKVQNGRTYFCSGWVRLDNTASASIKMTIKKTDGGGTTYTNVATGTGSNSSWVQLSGNYTLTVSGTLTELSIYFEGPNSGTNYYLDDVSTQ